MNTLLHLRAQASNPHAPFYKRMTPVDGLKATVWRVKGEEQNVPPSIRCLLLYASVWPVGAAKAQTGIYLAKHTS